VGKIFRKGITHRYYRAGLGPAYVQTTVGANDRTPEASTALEAMLRAADPFSRLQRVRERASAHRGVSRLHAEIDDAHRLLTEHGGRDALAATYALTAIERGLDLLDTQPLAEELATLRRAHGGRHRGLVESARARTRLPDAPALAEEIARRIQQGLALDEADACKQIARRHEVTPGAVRTRLRRARKATT
jgi:hypothetical protein